jgi:hypothetical protein
VGVGEAAEYPHDPALHVIRLLSQQRGDRHVVEGDDRHVGVYGGFRDGPGNAKPSTRAQVIRLAGAEMATGGAAELIPPRLAWPSSVAHLPT